MDLHREEYKKVQEAAHWIKSSMPFVPKASIILGTGMNSWLEQLEIIEEFSIREVPHMVPPVPTPQANAVILPSVCSHSSGPVVR